MDRDTFTAAYRRARMAPQCRDARPCFERDLEGGRWAHLYDHAQAVARSWALCEAGGYNGRGGAEWARCLRRAADARRALPRRPDRLSRAAARWEHKRQIELARIERA